VRMVRPTPNSGFVEFEKSTRAKLDAQKARARKPAAIACRLWSLEGSRRPIPNAQYDA